MNAQLHQRRHDLIVKEFKGTITDEERAELEYLHILAVRSQMKQEIKTANRELWRRWSHR